MEQLSTPANHLQKRVKKSLTSSLNYSSGLESLKEDEMSDFTASFNSHIHLESHNISVSSIEKKKSSTKLEKLLALMCIGFSDFAD